MAYWGQALVLGPNINAPMDPADEPRAAGRSPARRWRSAAEPRHASAAYIEALARRYAGKTERRAACDSSYADAMRDVARRFPTDLDAQAMWVESAMDLRPWKLLAAGRHAVPRHAGAAREARDVIARATPSTPARSTSISTCSSPPPDAGRAEAAADRLLPLMPAAGTWCTCRRTSTSGWAATPTPSAATSGGRRGRGLHPPVPGAGPLPHGLLPAQHPLHLVRGHDGKAARPRPSPRHARWRRR